MKIEDRTGEPLSVATVTVGPEEIIDFLQGLADVVEGKRPHLHFSQSGGPQLVVNLAHEGELDAIERQMDWWIGPLILAVVVLSVLGAITLLRWAAGLIG